MLLGKSSAEMGPPRDEPAQPTVIAPQIATRPGTNRPNDLFMDDLFMDDIDLLVQCALEYE
jgi:hypothetical protein